MSIIIRGMVMPTSCAGCFNRGCGLGREVVLPAHQRHKYCPLVPVPHHGRLIDADALMLRVNMHGTNKFGMLDEDIRKFINDAPTIIPTEPPKEEDNG